MAAAPHTPEHRAESAQGQRAAALGLVANIALASGKLAAGLLGHSYALIADSMESLADLIGSVIIWGGLRFGAVPPDDDHPYGHGKAESIAGLAVACIILVAGAAVLYEAAAGLFEQRSAPETWTLFVLLAVVITKEALYRYTIRISRRTRSQVVQIDAWHHRVDAITSLTACLGVGAAILGGPNWAYADNWAAVFGSAIILFNGFSLARGPWNELMDKAPDGVAERSAAVARTVEGVRAIEKVHSRQSGSRYFVDMHVEVDAEMSVAEAHVVSGKVKGRVRSEVPGVVNVLVHIEPHVPGSGKLAPPGAAA